MSVSMGWMIGIGHCIAPLVCCCIVSMSGFFDPDTGSVQSSICTSHLHCIYIVHTGCLHVTMCSVRTPALVDVDRDHDAYVISTITEHKQ